MGFWDKLEKWAESTNNWVEKMDEKLSEVMKEEKQKYDKKELLLHFKSRYKYEFSNSILDAAKKYSPKTVSLDYTDEKIATSTIEEVEDGIFKITIKGSGLTGRSEYGTFTGWFVFSLTLFSDIYAELVTTHRSTIEIKSEHDVN